MTLTGIDVVDNVLSCTVQHEQYKKALRDFEFVTQMSERGKPKGFLLEGVPGSGKTCLAKEMANANPHYRGEEAYVCRVVSFSMPAIPTIKGVCKMILGSMGRPYLKSDDEADLSLAVITLFKNNKVANVIIDEGHHLLNTTRKSNKEVADWLKTLMNNAGVSITLIGVTSVGKLLEDNGELRRRFSKRIVLKRYSVNSENEQQRFANALAKLVEDSGFSGNVDYLYDEEVLKMICFATDGRLGYIAPLLAEALRNTIEDGSYNINLKHLSDAFINEIWSEAPLTRNPFSKTFDRMPLRGQREPFYIESDNK